MLAEKAMEGWKVYKIIEEDYTDHKVRTDSILGGLINITRREPPITKIRALHVVWAYMRNEKSFVSMFYDARDGVFEIVPIKDFEDGFRADMDSAEYSLSLGSAEKILKEKYNIMLPDNIERLVPEVRYLPIDNRSWLRYNTPSEIVKFQESSK